MSDLQKVPGIGAKKEKLLTELGYSSLSELKEADADELYLRACVKEGWQLDKLLQEENCFSLKDLAVNGNDMMAIGLKGKSIGNALQACLDAVMDERVPNDHADLLALAQEQMLADTDQMLF